MKTHLWGAVSACLFTLVTTLSNAAVMAAVCATMLLLGAMPGGAVAQEVYSNDFDGSETFASGVSGALSGVTTTESVQGYSAVGFNGDMLRNDTGNPPLFTTLTLNNLPSHARISIDFLLAIIDSWDSLDNSIFSPDYFNISLDGTLVFQDTYNIDNPINNTFGLTDIGGKVQRGFNNVWLDQAFDTDGLLDFAHTASSVTIDFYASGAGWHVDGGGLDESWGIDDLRVTTVVPLPASLWLFAPALASLGFVGSRRKRAA
jgi:hypothetical protein